MLINGNFVVTNKNHREFIFWGESEKHKHKRGNPKNIAPLYPALADLKVVENVLGKKGEVNEKIIIIPDASNNDSEFNFIQYRITN